MLLNLVNTKQFIDLFEKSDKLDYTFFGFYSGRENELFFVIKDDIPKLREKQIDINKIKLFASENAQFLGYSLLIKNKK